MCPEQTYRRTEDMGENLWSIFNKCQQNLLRGGLSRWSVSGRLVRTLYRNGTRIIKFFLHLSKEEQRKRFLARIDVPEKNWKFSPADITERGFWKEYMEAYGQCLGATSTHHAMSKARRTP